MLPRSGSFDFFGKNLKNPTPCISKSDPKVGFIVKKMKMEDVLCASCTEKPREGKDEAEAKRRKGEMKSLLKNLTYIGIIT